MGTLIGDYFVEKGQNIPSSSAGVTKQQTPAKKKPGGLGGLLSAVARPFNQLLIEPTVSATKQLAAEVTGNKVAEVNARKNLFGGAKTAEDALKNIAGNAAQVGATFVAPGATGIGSKIVQGAKAGALAGGGQALANHEDVLKGTLGGATIGGSTSGILSKVLKSSGPKTSASNSFLKNLTTQGQQMQARGLGISGGAKVAGKELAPQDTERMLNVLKNEGIQPGNANSAARELNVKLKTYGQQIADHFKTNNAPLHPEDTKAIASNFIGGLGTTDPSVLKQAQILANDLRKNVKDTKTLWEFRKTLDSKIPDTKFMDAATSNKVTALKAMREYISKELGDTPGMQGYHNLSEIKPFLGKGMRELNQPSGGVIGRIVSSGPAQKVEAGIGKNVERLGKIGDLPVETTPSSSREGFLNRMLYKAAGSRAAPAVVTEGVMNNRTDPISQDQSSADLVPSLDLAPSSNQSTQPYNEKTTQSSDPFAPENVPNLVGLILSQGGTQKDVAEYLANVELYQKLTASSPKSKIGVVSSQNYANALSGSQSIQALRDKLTQNPSLLTKSAIPGGSLPIIGGYIKNISGTGELDALAYNIADKYLKLTTGATATDAEIKNTATKLMPRAGDSPDTVKLKLQQLEDYYNTIIGQANGQTNDAGIQDILANNGS